MVCRLQSMLTLFAISTQISTELEIDKQNRTHIAKAAHTAHSQSQLKSVLSVV